MIKEESRFQSSNIFEGMVSFRSVIFGIESSITDRKIEKVIFDKSKIKKISSHLSYIKAMSCLYNFELTGVEAQVIEEVAVGTNHGGILTYCTDRTLKQISGENIKKNGFYVYLDGIEDPYNFGYAVRSLYASGVDGVILSERNWMSSAGVVCRASAGASEMLPIYVGEPELTVRLFNKALYKIACADIDNSVSVYDADMKKPLLLAVGGERRGLSKAIREHSDITVRLDYGRDFSAALSAASAASILAFEVFRQNRKF